MLAALAVDGIFTGAGLVPTKRPSIDSITNRGIDWNYTTALNIVAFIVFGRSSGSRCGAARKTRSAG